MTFDATVNLGNVLTLIAMVLAAVAAYYGLKAAVERLDNKMDAQNKVIDFRMDALQVGVDIRHKENQRSFDGVTDAIKEARQASTTLAAGVGSLMTRVSVVETTLDMLKERE